MCRNATITLTAANALLMPTGTSVNVTPAGNTSTLSDTIVGSVFTNGVFIQDASTTDTDVLSATINGASTPTLVNIEQIDATFIGGNALTVTNSTGLNTVTVAGANGQITSTLDRVNSLPTVTLNSGYAATMILDGNFANAANAQTVNVNGTSAGAVLQVQDATNGAGVLETLNLVVNSNSTLTVQTNGTGADDIQNINISGAGNLTLGAALATMVTGTISAASSTGTLTASIGDLNATVTGSAQGDTFNVTAANTGTPRTVNGGGGADTFNFSTFQPVATNDIFNGGDGTDTVLLVAGTADVTAFSNMEVITISSAAVASTAANLTIGNTTGTFGQTLTINASALTTAGATFTMAQAVGTVTDYLLNVTGGNLADVLIGGTRADTLNGGTGADNITGGVGADIINVGASTADNDIVIMTADAETGTLALAAGANITGTLNVAAMDIVTGMGAGDIVRTTVGYTTNATTDNTANSRDTDVSTTVTVENGVSIVRGTYSAAAGTFTVGAGGADSILVYDANQATGAVSFEAVVLVGVTGTVTAASNTDITLA